MKEQIKLKENKDNFEKLLNRFEVFSSVENIKHFNDVYMPQINSFIE